MTHGDGALQPVRALLCFSPRSSDGGGELKGGDQSLSLLFPSFFGPFRYWSRRQAARTSLSLHLRLTPRSSIRSKRETANRIQAPGMKTRWNPNPQIKRTGVLMHTALLRPRRNPRKLQLTRIPNLSIQIRGPRVLMAALLWLSPNPAELKRTRI